MTVSGKTKALAVGTVAGLMLVTTVGEAMARQNYYAQGRGYGRHTHYRNYGYARRGYNPGAAVAGAALGVIGLAAGAAAANSYYNGYGPGYGYGYAAPAYGYGYEPYGYAPY